MSDAGHPAAIAGAARVPQPVRINALQAAWLREIGLPKALLPALPVADRAPVPALPTQGSVTARPPVVDGMTTRLPASNGVPASMSQTGAPSARAPVEDAATGAPARRANEAAGTAASPTPDAAAAASVASDKPARVVTTARSQPVQPPTPFVPVARNANDVEQADLHTLQPQVQACTACALSTSRQHAVFGSGPEHAEWMVVGEAPGEQEDVQALPFVGKSGQLLTEMLRAVGVGRDEGVFISNVIKCRPPGNRNPRPEEIEACKPFLLRQIQLVQPRRLLVVGRFAAQVLLGSDANLNSLRGRVHVFDDGRGRKIPLVVSYHPAYLLRSPQEKARAWRDLMLAASHEPDPQADTAASA